MVKLRRVMLLLALLGILVPQVYAYAESFQNLRSRSMGSTGIARSHTFDSFYVNPASLFFQEEGLFVVHGSYADSVVPAAYVAADPLPLIQIPENSISALFSSRFLALSIGLDFMLANRAPHVGYVQYDALNLSKLQLNLAYGWGNLAVGFSARGGNVLKRPSITISQESPITDYLKNTYLERYKVPEGQFFTTSAGLLVSYQWVSIGVVSQSLFEMDYQTNELVLEASTVLDTLGIGMAVSTPLYDRNNELNLIALNAAFDIANIGDDLLRSLRIGMEFKIQLSPDYSVEVRLGYRERRSSLSSILALNGDEGCTTYGLGVRLDKFELQAVLELPLVFYVDKVREAQDAYAVKLGISMVL
jgi:hypothetical protein